MSELQAIDRQASELAPPDLQTAQQLALSARDEREQAEQSYEAAKSELANIRQAFLAAPTPEGDDAVERAEQAVRSAERFAEAMLLRLHSAERARDHAERVAAASDLEDAGELREQLRHELAEYLHELRSLYTHASQVIAQVQALIARDTSLCEKANRAARKAGISGSAKPIDADLVRQAFCCWLTGGRPRMKHALTDVLARGMNLVLNELNDERKSPDERGAVLRLAVSELARASSAEVGDWFMPQHCPQFMSGTPSANRHRAAQDLLAALLQGPTGERT